MGLLDFISAAFLDAKRATFDKLLEGLAEAKTRRQEAAFSIALIALSAKLAKADGVVTDDEVEAFYSFFDFPEEEAKNVRTVYRLAQGDVAGFEHYLSRVAGLFEDNSAVLVDVLDCLYHIALADGVFHPREMAFLDQAAEIFKLTPACVRRIKASHLGLDDDDPFAVLGLEPEANEAEVRARYRELMRDHHPDSLMSRGVPASLVKIAEGRTAAINSAYERIKAEWTMAAG